MAKINLNLPEKNISTSRKNPYHQWREYQKENKQNFIMLPMELKKYITEIRTPAISLYLYYFYRSNNKNGDCWPSVKTTSDEFQVTQKTINNWNKELVDLKLIARVNENKSSVTTYILPISNYYYTEDSLTVEQFIKNYSEEKEGTLKGVINLFQWRKKIDPKKIETDTNYTKPYSVICLIFESIGKSKEGTEFKTIKGVIFPKNQFTDQEIELASNQFNNDIYQFDNPQFNQIELGNYEPIKKSLAISSKLDLTKQYNPEITALFVDLAENIDNLDQLPKTALKKP